MFLILLSENEHLSLQNSAVCLILYCSVCHYISNLYLKVIFLMFKLPMVSEVVPVVSARVELLVMLDASIKGTQSKVQKQKYI